MRWDNGWQVPQHLHHRRALHRAVRAAAVARPQARTAGKLRIIATWILVARVADYYWHVAPEFHNDGLSISLLDVALPLALGGIFMSLFVVAARRPLAAAGQRSGSGQGAASPCPLSTRTSTDLEYGPTPPGAKHEHTDIDVGVGYKFALWLAVAMLISAGIVYGTFWFFEGQAK